MDILYKFYNFIPKTISKIFKLSQIKRHTKLNYNFDNKEPKIGYSIIYR